jgi:hypothetical protein
MIKDNPVSIEEKYAVQFEADIKVLKAGLTEKLMYKQGIDLLKSHIAEYESLQPDASRYSRDVQRILEWIAGNEIIFIPKTESASDWRVVSVDDLVKMLGTLTLRPR